MVTKLKSTLVGILGAGVISTQALAFETEIDGFKINYDISNKGQICIKTADYDGSLGEKYPFKKLSIVFSNCYGGMESAISNGEEVGFFGRTIYANKIKKQYKLFQSKIKSNSELAMNLK